MASSSSIHHALQFAITCGMCDSSECVDSYCLGCKGNLCTTCKVSHVQISMFRNHKIIPIIEGLELKATEEECNIHSTYVCSFNCNICHKPVCNKCITSDHKGHDVDEIEAALKKVRREIKEYQETLETSCLPKYKGEVTKITQYIAECKKVTASVKSKIDEKRTEAITEVHKVCDELINRAEDKENRHISNMEKTLLNFYDKINEIEQLITESKKVSSKLCSEQIKFNQDKSSLIDLDVDVLNVAIQNFLTFVPGRVDRMQIAQQIGDLDFPQRTHNQLTETDIDASIIQRHKLEEGIRSVNTMDSNSAWISEIYPWKCIRLVTIDGKVIKRITTEFAINDFVITTSGDIIATDYHGSCIRILTQTGKVKRNINTSPSKPSGICLDNNNQDIVVCVNTSDESSCKLTMYNKDGKTIRSINYTDKPVGTLINQRVRLNNRGDYCVAHCDHKKVYVVHSNGELRYTYDGSGAGKMKKEFLPTGLCCDNNNHLFISDRDNHAIHMLDHEGKFIRFILTEQDYITNPYGLSIDKGGRLWVGHTNGDLCIVKYLK